MKYKLSVFFRPSQTFLEQLTYIQLSRSCLKPKSRGLEILNGKNWPGGDQIWTEVRLDSLNSYEGLVTTLRNADDSTLLLFYAVSTGK
jgi:hypothetical protein